MTLPARQHAGSIRSPDDLRHPRWLTAAWIGSLAPFAIYVFFVWIFVIDKVDCAPDAYGARSEDHSQTGTKGMPSWNSGRLALGLPLAKPPITSLPLRVTFANVAAKVSTNCALALKPASL